MTDFRRDTVFGKDGQFHDASTVAGTNQLVIDGVTRTLTDPAIGVRVAVDAQGRAFAILPTHGWQVLSRPDGSELVFDPFVKWESGNYGLGALRQMDTDCEVYIRGPHDGAGGCLIYVFDVNGHELRTQPAPYSSNGILAIDDATGAVTMVDQPPFSEVLGVIYRYLQSKDGWSSGQLQQGLPEGSLGVVKPDQSQWVTWPDPNNNLPSYLAAHGGEFRLAIQGVNTPAPDQVVLTRRPGDVVVPPIDPPIPPVDPPPSIVLQVPGPIHAGTSITIQVV